MLGNSTYMKIKLNISSKLKQMASLKNLQTFSAFGVENESSDTDLEE